jgi:hypothetical protein
MVEAAFPDPDRPANLSHRGDFISFFVEKKRGVSIKFSLPPPRYFFG